MVLTVPREDSDEEGCAPGSHGDDHIGVVT